MILQILHIAQMVLAGIFVLGGLIFLAISSIGVVRLPDFYSRNHAVGGSETLGSMLLLFGLAIYNGWELSSLKLIIILVFICLANPTATHIVAQAAYRLKLQPWVLKSPDIQNDIKSDTDQTGKENPIEGEKHE
jgi:multicomponent Na+:H+ antiporter subunit G